MATFNLQVGCDPKGAVITQYADGIVLMGALVTRGANDGDVKETGTTSAEPWAVALVQENIAWENQSAGTAQAQYADNTPCKVMTLVPGMILNLLAAGTINAGDKVCPSTDGKVVASAAAAWENEIGYAYQDITSGERGPIIITKSGPQ